MKDIVAIKTRLAAELAAIVFGEDHVPSEALGCIDEIVDENFEDWSAVRLCAVLDDLCEMRASLGDCTPDDIDGPTGVTNTNDWMRLKGVVHDCQHVLGFPRYADEDDDTGGYGGVFYGR